MSTDSVINEDIKCIEIVPLTRDTDGACTTEYDSGDWSAQDKQEILPAVKQEPQDVCCIGFCLIAAEAWYCLTGMGTRC